MEKSNGNLNLRTFLIILGIGVGILTTAFGVMRNSISSVDESVIVVRGENQLQGERISTNEANVANVAKQLDRIETKLDKLINAK